MEYIRLIDLPTSIHGATLEDSEGENNIYINSRLCEAERSVAVAHEMAHARAGHVQSHLTLEEMENDAKEKELEIRRQILCALGHPAGGREESP